MAVEVQALRPFLEPWYEAIREPQRAQEQVLHRLLSAYEARDSKLLVTLETGAGNIDVNAQQP